MKARDADAKQPQPRPKPCQAAAKPGIHHAQQKSSRAKRNGDATEAKPGRSQAALKPSHAEGELLQAMLKSRQANAKPSRREHEPKPCQAMLGRNMGRSHGEPSQAETTPSRAQAKP